MTNALTVGRDNSIHATYLRSRFALHPARIVIAGGRLRVFQKSRWLQGFGLIGWYIARKMTGTLAIDVAVGDIAQLVRAKFALNTALLDVTMKDGTTYRFGLRDAGRQWFRTSVAMELGVNDPCTESWVIAPARVAA